jgi:hypothetical protein
MLGLNTGTNSFSRNIIKRKMITGNKKIHAYKAINWLYLTMPAIKRKMSIVVRSLNANSLRILESIVLRNDHAYASNKLKYASVIVKG